MKVARISVIYLVFLLKLKQIHSGNPDIPSPDQDQIMDKEQVFRALHQSVRGMMESGAYKSNKHKSFKRLFRTVKSLGYCMAKGNMEKHELVSCLNTIVGEMGINPPVPFMTCLGEYILCSSRACLRKLQSKKTSTKAIKCVVKCLPSAVLCISRAGPSPRRQPGL